MTPATKLWAANAHQFGPGKVHILKADGAATVCGKSLDGCPGRPSAGPPTCKVCIDSTEKRIKWEARKVEIEAEAAERERQREEERGQWWSDYTAYLRTPAWLGRRAAVMRRAHSICEACGTAPATEVHHLTYDHAFDEPLFDLVAICAPCHRRITAADRLRRGGR